MSNYLSGHPEVYFSSPKELYYFNTEFDDSYRKIFAGLDPARAETAYLRFFDRARDKHRAVGEGTAVYLLSENALSRLKAFNPQARIIVILRDPVEVACSMHGYGLNLLAEDELDFMTAWELQEERRKGLHVPDTCSEPLFLQYRNNTLFGRQVERLYSLFDRNQVLLLFFEDFRSNPRSAYLRALEFLGLRDDGKTHFPVANGSRVARSAVLNRAINLHPPWIDKLVQNTKHSLGIKSLGLQNLLIRTATREGKRTALAPVDRERLIPEYLEDIERLEDLTHRDLGSWKT